MKKHPSFGGDRREYSLWFLDQYSKEPFKSQILKEFGEPYYLEVMRIYKQRVDENNFDIGPQTKEDWITLQEKLK